MDELNSLLRPSWGSEKWISEGWERLTADEKNLIKGRMDALFKDGLPFELKHNKLLYIYTFSLLAQLEVLAIQIPLKFESQMSSLEDRERMHVQLLDEIFHGMVFTKVLYLLCAPHALPPAYNANIETLCNFIRNEDCPKIGVMLLNLVSEGWIEEIFYSLKANDVAPKIFEIILEDEHRHVCEADLYREIGLPDMKLVKEKLEYLEEQLLTKLFLQYKYVNSVCTLLGAEGTMGFIQSLNKKHTSQLQKIHLQPSQKWILFMQTLQNILPKINQHSQSNIAIEMTPIRQALMTQWDNPSDPTMVGEFNINVSCIDFFNKKYPSETITTLMLQAISAAVMENDSYRNYLSHKQLCQSKEAYVGLIVKLPDCGDHMGTIVFKDCHKLTVFELTYRIRTTLKMMVYCFKKRAELEQAFPHLKLISQGLMDAFANDFYEYPIPGTPVISLSNIGFCGYTQTKSPLRSNEAMKVTLLEVDRKQVWNKMTNEFEAQDLLPVSISADHRVFDGNLPIPKLLMGMFDTMFQKMHVDMATPQSFQKPQEYPKIMIKALDNLMEDNLELAYKSLSFLQTVWGDFLELQEIFTPEMLKNSLGKREIFNYFSLLQ